MKRWKSEDDPRDGSEWRGGGGGRGGGRLAFAAEGNFLEAVNLSLNTLAQRFRGRDLTRTGEALVVVTAGSGVFEVTHDLNKKTKHRCIDDGIAVNLVCLGPVPSHVVPLFIVRDQPVSGPSRSERHRRLSTDPSMRRLVPQYGSEENASSSSPGYQQAAFGSEENLSAMANSGSSVGSMAFYRLRASGSEELATLLENAAGGRSSTQRAQRSSPRPAAAGGGDGGGGREPGEVQYSIVRWLVLSWFYPERGEEMLPRNPTADKPAWQTAAAPATSEPFSSSSAAANDPDTLPVVGANASIKLLSEEEDWKSPVSQIIKFLTATRTAVGPPSPIGSLSPTDHFREEPAPASSAAVSAAAQLKSMLEGSETAIPTLEEGHLKEEHLKATEAAEEEEFHAACRCVQTKAQSPPRCDCKVCL